MKKLGLLLVLLFATNCFATIHTVNLSGLSFSPQNITITQGDTVRWVKTGGFHNVAHSATVPLFRSGEPTSAAFTYDFAFAAPMSGLYNYECEVHAGSGMVGTVTVNAAGNPPGAPSNPIPIDNAAGMPTLGFLIWDAATDADHYIVRFGTANPPPVVNNNFTATMYPYQDLSNGTHYFWRITAVNSFGQTDGPLWQFTTAVALPGQASNPFPANNATNVPLNTLLGWDAADFAESYEVFLGTQEPLASIGTTGLTTITPPNALQFNTTYLWRVNATNESGTTEGVTWSFSTPLDAAAHEFIARDFRVSAPYPNPFNNTVSLSLDVASPVDVSITAFDALGRQVAILHSGVLSSGSHQIQWQAEGIASGAYYLSVRSAQGNSIFPVTLLK